MEESPCRKKRKTVDTSSQSPFFLLPHVCILWLSLCFASTRVVSELTRRRTLMVQIVVPCCAETFADGWMQSRIPRDHFTNRTSKSGCPLDITHTIVGRIPANACRLVPPDGGTYKFEFLFFLRQTSLCNMLPQIVPSSRFSESRRRWGSVPTVLGACRQIPCTQRVFSSASFTVHSSSSSSSTLTGIPHTQAHHRRQRNAFAFNDPRQKSF